MAENVPVIFDDCVDMNKLYMIPFVFKDCVFLGKDEFESSLKEHNIVAHVLHVGDIKDDKRSIVFVVDVTDYGGATHLEKLGNLILFFDEFFHKNDEKKVKNISTYSVSAVNKVFGVENFSKINGSLYTFFAMNCKWDNNIHNTAHNINHTLTTKPSISPSCIFDEFDFDNPNPQRQISLSPNHSPIQVYASLSIDNTDNKDNKVDVVVANPPSTTVLTPIVDGSKKSKRREKFGHGLAKKRAKSNGSKAYKPPQNKKRKKK